MDLSPDVMDRIYLYKNRGKSVVTRMEAVLDTDIREDILREAVSESLETYPLFGIKPALTEEGKAVFREAYGKLPVFEKSTGRHRMGTEDTGGHLFCIYYGKNSIELTASHIVGDARQDIDFLDQVICNYYRLIGTEEDGEGKAKHAGTEECTGLLEAAAAYRERMAGGTSGQYAADREEAAAGSTFAEACDRPYDGTGLYVKRSVSFAYSRLLEHAGRYDISPMLILVDTIALAMERVYDTKGKDLKICVSIDMRKVYGIDSMHNFSTGVDLIYPAQGKEMEIEKRYTVLKETYGKLKDTAGLTDGIIGNGELIKLLETYLDLGDYKTVEAVMNKGLQEKLPSFYIASLGRMKLSKTSERHIRSVEFNGIPTTGETCYYAYVFGDTCKLNMASSHDNERVAGEIAEILREKGIDTRDETVSLEDTDFLDVQGFERV